MNDTYNPDRWVILKLTNEDGENQYRVHTGWYGGYLDGDYWRLSSGIESIVENNGIFTFTTRSGSEYICNQTSYGMSGLMLSALTYIKSTFKNINIDVLEEDQLPSLPRE